MSISKSLTKRLRITKNGKIVRRPTGIGHFRTRRNGKGVRDSRKTRSFDFPMKTLLNY